MDRITSHSLDFFFGLKLSLSLSYFLAIYTPNTHTHKYIFDPYETKKKLKNDTRNDLETKQNKTKNKNPEKKKIKQTNKTNKQNPGTGKAIITTKNVSSSIFFFVIFFVYGLFRIPDSFHWYFFRMNVHCVQCVCVNRIQNIIIISVWTRLKVKIRIALESKQKKESKEWYDHHWFCCINRKKNENRFWFCFCWHCVAMQPKK